MSEAFRWTRTYTIWLLIAVALVPAALVGAVFGGWEAAPAILRWIVLVAGPAGTIAAVYLIVARKPQETSG
jgi:undecaprenyl pyrophosphate phosphatase UppP